MPDCSTSSSMARARPTASSSLASAERVLAGAVVRAAADALVGTLARA
jgi:hypothetical protein